MPVLVSALVAAAAAGLWAAGLQLFLRAGLSTPRKIGWVSFLVATGACIGGVLPMADLMSRAAWLAAILPALACADVLLFRSARGFNYWIRACGFEVVTVFATAGAARYALDVLKHVHAVR